MKISACNLMLWQKSHGREALSSFGSFRTIFRTTFPSSLYSTRIESPSDGMITNTGEILYSSAPDKDNGVLLKVMPHTRNIRCHLNSIGKPYSGYFPQGRVWLLRCGGVDFRANSPLLRAALKPGAFCLCLYLLSSLPNKLTNCRHNKYLITKKIDHFTEKTEFSPWKNCEILADQIPFVKHQITISLLFFTFHF